MLFDQMHASHTRGDVKSKAYQRAREEIQRELAKIRFTARTIDRLCADVQQQVAQVRAIERRILQIVVSKSGMPREKFVESFPGHETDLGWTERAARGATRTARRWNAVCRRSRPNSKS